MYIIASTLLGGAVSVFIAAMFAYKLIDAWINRLVSYAVGVMLAAVFLDILPEAFQSEVPVTNLLATVLGGLLSFFLLEKVALWRHAHTTIHDHETVHPKPAGMMILIGDSFHNFVDGILIAAAFLTDIRLGITTAIAVVAHEIPQEIGDFVVLLESGYSKQRALWFNTLSGMASVVGGVLGYFILGYVHAFIPYALAIAAASFIYIAVADLVPGLHRHIDSKSSFSQGGLMLLGVFTVVLQHQFIHF